MKTFVVAHGAWTGAWSWEKVIDLVHKKGHKIYVPTLSGLCERSHLAKFPIDLDMHIADIENEIRFKDLRNVTLIGHSYGGFVATGVADRNPKFISALVYLDAFIPKDNSSFSDLNPEWNHKGPLVPPPDFDLPEDIRRKITGQPIGTMTQKIHLTGAYQSIQSKTFIQCTGWDGPFQQIALELKKDPSWSIRELQSGHDAPFEAPDALVDLLLSVD